MRLIRGIAGLTAPAGRCALTIGSYDGLHLGHQALLARLIAQAQEAALPAVMVTFEPMPREYLQPQEPPARLTSLRERWRLLELLPLDYLCVLRFDEALRNLSPQEFAELLARRLNAVSVVVGHDFRFGRQGAATAEVLSEAGVALGFGVEIVPAVKLGGERISSSGVRTALALADFALAGRWLGRAWTMRGRVRGGERLGRKLGFPTANLALERRRSPVAGVFAVRVHGIGAAALPGVASLGTRPTVNGSEALLETHVFDFGGDLYGREIAVEFVAKLREEARFASLDALTAQMHCDAAEARRILGA
jgi:riboflavin kinase / FMN adenylyltransferase